MRGSPDSAAQRKSPSGATTPSTVSPREPTMSNSQDEARKNNGSLDAGGIDARDVLCGRLDDTTVRQAVEAGR